MGIEIYQDAGLEVYLGQKAVGCNWEVVHSNPFRVISFKGRGVAYQRVTSFQVSNLNSAHP